MRIIKMQYKEFVSAITNVLFDDRVILSFITQDLDFYKNVNIFIKLNLKRMSYILRSFFQPIFYQNP